MSKKEEPKKVSQVVHEAGEFQLTRELLHIPPHVDRKVLGIDVGGFGNMAVDKVPFDELIDTGIEFFNNEDFNNDHRSDLAEVAPIAKQAIILAGEVLPLIDQEAVKKELLALPAKYPHLFKDAAAAGAKLVTLFTLAEAAAAKLAPKA